MSRQSDHNLLLGILALQLDFVSRDALLKGMNAWLLQKHRSLAELLVEQGGMSPASERLLQQVVNAHLALHENDPKQSLAASMRMADLAGALEEIDDEELQRSLADFSMDGDRAPSSTVIGDFSAIDGRFVVVRPHASGGLGEVTVAIDRELNREVALKVVRNHLAGNAEACSRFRMEAEVTGGLEHPGIVPVYGLGAGSDGRPFYAMRFIRGETLNDAICRYHTLPESDSAARNLAFRDLLRRFMDVCDAVSYAHSRGVLHRDLKPGNIMLGKYGETLVVDWGLARVQGKSHFIQNTAASLLPLQVTAQSDVRETQHGRVMGTLPYMSPEQAEGKLDQLGPGTDVYAMGAILYEILTSRPPIEQILGVDGFPDIAATLKQVREGVILPAHSVNPAASPALSAVCSKALSRYPQDRYPSVASLSQDIDRWLADEAVSAIRESILQRSLRWTRKHQTLTTSTLAVLAVTAIGLVVFSAVMSEKNTELTRLNHNLDQSNSQLTQSVAREQGLRATAEHSESVARQQSQLVLSTLTSVVNDLQDGLKNVSGSGEIRRKLLQTALQKFEGVALPYLEQTSVDSSVMTALIEIGDVVIRFGADDSTQNDSASGHAPPISPVLLARSFYLRANEIAVELAGQPGSKRSSKDDLAVTLNRLAKVELQSGHTADALERCRQGVELTRTLCSDNPSDDDAQIQLCTWYCQIGDIRMLTGELTAAEESFQSALIAAEQLFARDPGNAQFRRVLAVTCARLGNVELRSGRLNEALAFYERDLGIGRELAEAAPDDVTLQRDLVVSCTKLGDVQYRAGNLKEAIAAYREAISRSEELSAREPDDLLLLRDTAVICNMVGDVLFQTNDIPAAFEIYDKGHALSRRIAATDDRNAVAQRDLSVSLERLGDCHLSLERTDRAIECFEQSRELRSRLVQEGDSAQSQTDLMVSLFKLGSVYQGSERFDEALANYRPALEILQKLDSAGQLPPQQKVWIAVIEKAIQQCESR